MPDDRDHIQEPRPVPAEIGRSVLSDYRHRGPDRYWLHALLFAATAASTIWAGGEWAQRTELWDRGGLALYLDPVFLADGLRYAIPFLLFLTVHEFGHYLTARRHGVDVSLPFYIPIPPGVPIVNIGTFGAVIRIRERIERTRQLFDIGVAGPIAGFAVAAGVLAYAIATLPPPTYLLDLGAGHDALKQHILEHGTFPTEPPLDEFGFGPIAVGDTLLFALLRLFVADMPPAWELYHYPTLFAGWLTLFFTALNLLPVGQLDGGHVTYALYGSRVHSLLARVVVMGLLFSGAVGAVHDFSPLGRAGAEEYGQPEWVGLAAVWVVVLLVLRWLCGKLFATVSDRLAAFFGLALAVLAADMVGGIAEAVGWSGWLLWSMLIVFVIKVDHPPVLRPEPLSRQRHVLGLIALIIFVLCFSPQPLYIAG